MGGHLCSEMGQMGKKVVKVAQRRRTKEQEQEKSGGKWPLGHPFREKVVFDTIFQGFQHTVFSLE